MTDPASPRTAESLERHDPNHPFADSCAHPSHDERETPDRCLFNFMFEGGSFGLCPACGSEEPHVRLATPSPGAGREGLDVERLQRAIAAHHVQMDGAAPTSEPHYCYAICGPDIAAEYVREGLLVKEHDAIVVGAESILRHAAREAHAALTDKPSGGSEEGVDRG